MKKLAFLSFLLFSLFSSAVNSEMISGKVNQDEMIPQSQILDAKTRESIPNAKITIPSKNFTTFSDIDGRFQLKADIDKASILLIEKEGYRPFTITINRDDISQPLKIAIEKLSKTDIILDNTLYHLGDNVFSKNSANSSQFRAKSVGPFLTKQFNIEKKEAGDEFCLVIGSIIGLDTKTAHTLGQNAIKTAYSSPASIFLNGHKIGEIDVNGDGHRIRLPYSLLRARNEIAIQTGRNLFQNSYIDYDDIEIMGLTIEVSQSGLSGIIK